MDLYSTQYLEKVYAAVLGKMIGVYLGRPVEGWSYERIQSQVGDIHFYVHDKVGLPLIVTDDDLTGTFTFLRALEDMEDGSTLTSQFIGKTWLNYLISERTILWWGGMGNSTEHTAYLRLKQGIDAPLSGSATLNTKIVSEQIGAQIFIDGWALVSPGDPIQAAQLAKEAATVSHDGEAVFAAQFLAVLESLAFIESDISTLLDKAMFILPTDSVIYSLVNDIRLWHATESDWRRAREFLEAKYGYDQFGGNCHVVPNHGVILLALLYGNGDFHRSMMIVNTCGWDTDCNAGNLGCLLGILRGLNAFENGPDWRAPLHDILYLPTADGGRAITDAVNETFHIVKAAHRLQNKIFHPPKNGARFHFSLPGSVQGFQANGTDCVLENKLNASGNRVLALSHSHLKESETIRAETATFIPPNAKVMPGSYEFLASPNLYCGQTIRACLIADSNNETPVQCNLFIRYYGESDELKIAEGPAQILQKRQQEILTWTIPQLNSEASPAIVSVGWACRSISPGINSVSVALDWLTWDGAPQLILKRFKDQGVMATRMWVNALDRYEPNHPDEPYLRMIHNQGRGLLLLGCREWAGYQFLATLKPHMAEGAGIAVCVQGMERYYALILTAKGKLCLIKRYYKDIILAEIPWTAPFDADISLCLKTDGNRLKAVVNSTVVFDIIDQTNALLSGGVGLVCETGRVACLKAKVLPLDKEVTNAKRNYE